MRPHTLYIHSHTTESSSSSVTCDCVALIFPSTPALYIFLHARMPILQYHSQVKGFKQFLAALGLMVVRKNLGNLMQYCYIQTINKLAFNDTSRAPVQMFGYLFSLPDTVQ